MEKRKLKFNENGKFVIMQVSDPQDLQFVRHTMVRMLNRAYDEIKPDLVIFTGDNILGNHLRDARFGSKHVVHTKREEYERMKKAIGHICDPLEKRGIPFTMIYGNHDDRNEITKEEQADIYRSYLGCTGLDNPDKSVDVDTFNLPVFSSDESKILFNLWLLDSAWYDKQEDKCHEAVKESTVKWYVKTSEELKKENDGKPVPSLMFQHIPLPEAAVLLTECGKDDVGALEIKKDGCGTKYIKLDEKKASGFLGEPISACKENYGQFEAIKAQNDVKALVFGHDHRNNFIGEIDGIKIIQTSACSFRCYGNHLRGVRIFELNERKPEEFKTQFLTYSDICGNSVFSKIAYIWDADGCGKQKAALCTGVGVTAAAASIAAYKLFGRK